MALLRHRPVRQVLAINVLLSVGWDLHTVFVPIYGARIGLTASQIGMVLSAFAAATLAVRLAMPSLARRLTEHQVLTAALLVAGAVYLVFPFSQSALTFGALSFCLGLGLGSGQPMVMSLLHVHTPAGRIGEAVGVADVAGPVVVGRRAAAVRCGRFLARPRPGVLVRGHLSCRGRDSHAPRCSRLTRGSGISRRVPCA